MSRTLIFSVEIEEEHAQDIEEFFNKTQRNIHAAWEADVRFRFMNVRTPYDKNNVEYSYQIDNYGMIHNNALKQRVELAKNEAIPKEIRLFLLSNFEI